MGRIQKNGQVCGDNYLIGNGFVMIIDGNYSEYDGVVWARCIQPIGIVSRAPSSREKNHNLHSQSSCELQMIQEKKNRFSQTTLISHCPCPIFVMFSAWVAWWTSRLERKKTAGNLVIDWKVHRRVFQMTWDKEKRKKKYTAHVFSSDVTVRIPSTGRNIWRHLLRRSLIGCE